MSANMMRRYLTEDEQARLFKTIGNTAGRRARRDYQALKLMRDTGMRANEFVLISVHAAEAALETNYLYVPKQHRKGGKHDHTVLVTSPIRDALRALIEIHAALMEGALPDPERPLLLSRLKRGMSVRALELRVAYWAKRAGLPPGVSPHWFRHTRAMNIMRRSTARDPRGVVQGALGHATIASSAVYTQLSREEFEAALHEVDGAPRYRKRDIRRLHLVREAA